MVRMDAATFACLTFSLLIYEDIRNVRDQLPVRAYSLLVTTNQTRAATDVQFAESSKPL